MTIESIQADPKYIKFINKKQVLHYIQQYQGKSRAEIAKALRISKPTASKIVDELLQEGWINESESTEKNSSGGRKPFQLYFNRNAQFIMGIDIGGTTVEMALVNLEGEMIGKMSFPTQTYLPDNLLEKLSRCVFSLIAEQAIEPSQILGVGIGVPGMTDVEKGIVIDAPSLGWKQYPFKEKMKKLLPFPMYIDNDVNVAALGEHWKGAGKNKDNMLQVTLGTGIGCGIIIDRQLYRGTTFAAGEIGYMVTDKHAAEKKYNTAFSGYGFLDSHVGGPSITERMLNVLDVDRQSEEEWTAKKVFELALAGDEISLEVVNDALSHLAFALVNVIAIINPQCVVIGGGISKSLDPFLPTIEQTINAHIPVETEVAITRHANISLLGSAYLVLNEHDSILKV